MPVTTINPRTNLEPDRDDAAPFGEGSLSMRMAPDCKLLAVPCNGGDVSWVRGGGMAEPLGGMGGEGRLGGGKGGEGGEATYEGRLQ